MLIQNDSKQDHSAIFTSMKAKLDRIPIGIKLFWEDFKEVRRLSVAKGNADRGNPNNPRWSRRELDLAKRNQQDLFLVASTGIAFCIPGGGIAILGVLLLKPRYLTTHFWSDEMKEEFILQDYLHKVSLQQKVNMHLRENEYSMLPRLAVWANVLHSCESRAYLQKLGLYHRCVKEPLYKILSLILGESYVNQLTKLHVECTFDEIVSDDILLVSESAVKDLNRDELQRACLLRMICSPALTSDELMTNLESWLRTDKKSKLAAFLLLS